MSHDLGNGHSGHCNKGKPANNGPYEERGCERCLLLPAGHYNSKTSSAAVSGCTSLNRVNAYPAARDNVIETRKKGRLCLMEA